VATRPCLGALAWLRECRICDISNIDHLVSFNQAFQFRTFIYYSERPGGLPSVTVCVCCSLLGPHVTERIAFSHSRLFSSSSYHHPRLTPCTQPDCSAMLGDKKKSSRRLSSLFSSGSSESSSTLNSTKPSPAPSSESSSRLAKVRNRLSSATHLAPEQSPPSAPKSPNHLSVSSPAAPPVVPADLEPLEPPPPLDVPSRASSPSGSRPGTPSVEPANKLKKLRRKSGLFGSGPAISVDGLAGANQAGAGAGHSAWIVGHKGKVPYDLTLLLNGDKVCCCGVGDAVVGGVLTT